MKITVELLKNFEFAEMYLALFLTLSILSAIAFIIMIIIGKYEDFLFNKYCLSFNIITLIIMVIMVISIIFTIKYTGDYIEYKSIIDFYKYQHENLLPIAPIN